MNLSYHEFSHEITIVHTKNTMKNERKYGKVENSDILFCFMLKFKCVCLLII